MSRKMLKKSISPGYIFRIVIHSLKLNPNPHARISFALTRSPEFAPLAILNEIFCRGGLSYRNAQSDKISFSDYNHFKLVYPLANVIININYYY